MTTYKIEQLNRWGQWKDDWAGERADNVFATETEAWETLPIITASFGDAPDDDANYTPDYRVVEIE